MLRPLRRGLGRVPKEIGKLIGAEDIGDIEKKIGKDAEVYADKLSDTEYSIYGNKDYYVKIK